MSRFSSIRTEKAQRAPAEPPAGAEVATPPGPAPHRVGKKAVSGYFSPDVSRGLHMLALELNTNLQALMGEAFDDLMRKYNKHPFGER